MMTFGRMLLVAGVALGVAGAAVGQTEPATGDVDQVALESDTSTTGARSPLNTPFGLRAGYTSWKSVDQVHVGGHVYLGELWPNVEFTPNIEFGFGDETFIMTLNGDLTYLFSEIVGFPWALYGGGALSFNLVNPESGDTQTDLGLSGLVGTRYTFANDHRGMAEIRFGIMDSPAFKLTFGYTLF
jgi:hypothetical protein